MYNPIIGVYMHMQSHGMSRCDSFCPENMPVFLINVTILT